MTKKIIGVVVLFLITFTIFALAGCEKADKGLSVGFDSSYFGDPAPSDCCAYKSEVSEFDINDATLYFFYGGIFSESIEFQLEREDIPKIRLYFHNPELGDFEISPFLEENLYFIREVEENYISEKYRWKGRSYTQEDGIELTIPSELFIGESGKIGFIVAGDNILDSVDGYICISSIWIYYKVDGDKVILSGQKFE